MGTLDPSDYNDTSPISLTTQPLCQTFARPGFPVALKFITVYLQGDLGLVP